MDDTKNKSLLYRLFKDSHPTTPETAPAVTTPTAAQPQSPVPDQAQQDAQDKIEALMNNTTAVSPEQLAKAEAELTVTGKLPSEPEVLGTDGVPLAIDAKVHITVPPGAMEAYAEVLSPRNGGAEVTARHVRTMLQEAGVTTGLLEDVIDGFGTNPPYGKGPVMVAQGTPKQDGVDAIITEHFPRQVDLTPFKKADGTVNFKELNVTREIKEGTVMISLTPQTAGTHGINVRGEDLKPMPGKPKNITRGNNTVLSEDGLKLLAAVNGNLSYAIERFNVDPSFVVEGNVDNTTGNIDFCGDVLIKGDVREGYVIRSGGTVRVKGTMEGASIYAERDIFMDGGFNGMKHGEVSSKTNIFSKFLQNCTVYAKESIVTEAIINSVVDCDGSIQCIRGKGTVVGGKVTALHFIEADTIGSDVNTPTSITVGLSPTIIAEKQALEREVREVEDAKEALRKNIIYLERCSKMGPLSPKNLQLVDTCNKQKVILMVREGKSARRLAEVNTIIEEAAAGSYVKAKVIYPSCKVTIQNLSLMTKAVQNRAMIRREEGDLKLGSY